MNPKRNLWRYVVLSSCLYKIAMPIGARIQNPKGGSENATITPATRHFKGLRFFKRARPR